MKKALVITLIMCLGILLLFTGCSSKPAKNENGGLKIVTTIFPEYDWTMNILGEQASKMDVKLLTDKGVDLHSFQPNVTDMTNISDCDILIHVGGESDEFIEDALQGAVNENMIVVNLMEVIGDSLKIEELKEGMDGEAEEDEYDEHIWLSLKNAETASSAICDALCEADPDNSELYKANLETYLKKLSSLDEKYTESISKMKNKTLIFGDRFPFRYLVDDYGLEYFAAFKGCSSETDASFKTITYLAGKLDELDASSVLVLEGSNRRIAEAIIQNTKGRNQKILTLDSMQSVSAEDIKNGATYLGIMEDDLKVIEEALSN